MSIKIALAGNPNCGKTTLFNALTGSNQYVGNWPGVTVEKKEGRLKTDSEVIIQDLPGIYSLSPYSPEEIVSRNYLVKEKPDAILNVIDGSNIERNLYLTTQLIELSIPVVVAVNMMDIVKKNGDEIDPEKLGKMLGCKVVTLSALKGDGSEETAAAAVEAVRNKSDHEHPHVFAGGVEHALAHIEESIEDKVETGFLRWYAIKLFERDEKVLEELNFPKELMDHIEGHIKDAEKELDDDSDSIIANQRYSYIETVIAKSVKKNREEHGMSTSDKVDAVLTNRVLALPIFIVIMWLMYAIAMGDFPISIGTKLTDYVNDNLFPWISEAVGSFLLSVGCADWLTRLITEGIIGGCGAVLGFVPQMLVLFFLLSILEDIGYMSRIAFIMDKLFRRFGLSGKSFIPMLVGTGCGVPGVMASRTIENDRDRRMTIMTTCFMPCGAKMPIIGLFAGALFGGSSMVATSAYFIGVAAIVISGLILKKTKPFLGESATFVMELPQYHIPAPESILRTTWERGWEFIKRAGTVILASSVILWFLQSFGFVNGAFGMIEDSDVSLLAGIGNVFAFVFAPLGFGTWQASVATITGLLAKENVVSTFGVLYPGNLSSEMAKVFNPVTAYSFMIFNLLCAPCFAAIGAIKSEMKSAKWTWAAIGYMCAFAYAISLITYQLGTWFVKGTFGVGSIAAIVCIAALVYLLVRKESKPAKKGGGVI